MLRTRFLGVTALSLLASAVVGISIASAGPPLPPHGPKADTDGDGQVSRAEMEASAMARFDAGDADKDGFISREEADQQHQAKMQQRMQQRAERKSEMRASRQSRGMQRREDKWKQMDVDGDEKISRAEMEAGARSRFDTADSNGDGVVTRDEMQKGKKAHRGKRQGAASDE